MHKSEKWKWRCLVASDSSRPHGLQPTQAPLSMGFSRQEYWSGVPLPSLKVRAKLLQSCLTLCDPMDCSSPGSSVQGILQAKFWRRLPFPSLGDFLAPGMKPVSRMSPVLTSGFFTTHTTWEVSLKYTTLSKLITIGICWLFWETLRIFWLQEYSLTQMIHHRKRNLKAIMNNICCLLGDSFKE